MRFEKSVFSGYLVQGELNAAISYLKDCGDQSELYGKYYEVFEKDKRPVYEEDAYLDKILDVYRKYYREIFYLNNNADEAEKCMSERFGGIFGISDKSADVGEIEEIYVSKAFTDRGFHFLGGCTGGFFGPYIWSDTEKKKYAVELPDGNAEYTVMLLDGFISRSWLDYISFGMTGTGGWTGSDGIISCVRSSYDVDSEAFRVSLLKHEAQHSVDIARFKSISSDELEYRAKLVELIYSEQRNMLEKFLLEADDSRAKNGHSLASHRIAEKFSAETGLNIAELKALSAEKVQSVASKLFYESSKELKEKYTT